jgi:hypothetical protein
MDESGPRPAVPDKKEASGMTTRSTASSVLDQQFLEIRADLVKLAAALDRIDRADGSVSDDPRMEQIARTLTLLASSSSDRAEQVLQTFSLPYDENWRDRLRMDTPTK